MVVRTAIAALFVLALLASPAHAGDGSWGWPLDGHDVGERFDPPDTEYGAGHRGVDLPGRAGEAVRAVAPGTVVFAGSVAGTGVVTVDHGGERSTYQPLDPRVGVGDTVRAGDELGTLRAAGTHCATVCLHLGRLPGSSGREAYLDPLDRLGTVPRVRLVDPDGPLPEPPAGPSGTGALRRPVGGPITSPFGPRTHPVTGVHKLHDGTDFGAGCGTPVHAAGAGTVVGRSSGGPYGQRISVRHGEGLETSYNHLSRQSVSVGQRVTPATVVGRVGSTGRSTGCHLHFTVRRDGRFVDPMGLL